MLTILVQTVVLVVYVKLVKSANAQVYLSKTLLSESLKEQDGVSERQVIFLLLFSLKSGD